MDVKNIFIRQMKYEDFKDNEYLETYVTELRKNGVPVLVRKLDDLFQREQKILDDALLHLGAVRNGSPVNQELFETLAKEFSITLKHLQKGVKISDKASWILVNENDNGIDAMGSGCNSYFSEKNGVHYDIHYYWFSGTFSNHLNQKIFHKHDFIADYFDENGVYIKNDDEVAAELVKNNIMRKDGDVYMSNIPVTTRNGANNINHIFKVYENEIIPHLTGFIRNIYNEYKRFVPERLHDQIRGNLGCYCHNIISIVQNELVKQNLLRDYKADEVFTDNVWFVVG